MRDEHPEKISLVGLKLGFSPQWILVVVKAPRGDGQQTLDCLVLCQHACLALYLLAREGKRGDRRRRPYAQLVGQEYVNPPPFTD